MIVPESKSPDQFTLNSLDSPIDFEGLYELYGDDSSMFQFAFEELMQILPKYFAKLEAAIADSDMAKILYEAHRLKGSTATVSVKKIPDLCSAVEDAARVEDLGQINACTTEIRTQVSIVLKFLQNYSSGNN
ncbi:Hpt domain protein [[Leptolyngbya] sp. PCC 7376]|uniref:Hpt domain-containing protein n=1 Tax=[Leptolyngbya] sp. PCC 7376 TaxID=111781 RepID=UPI00029EDB7F|nr:Hpt domain-containing protein [[Leptolyngbya] sp. PCC 7376]AFY40505.1 Hpt domain protein [[Leptolyngbya] sp. PCC 7376]